MTGKPQAVDTVRGEVPMRGTVVERFVVAMKSCNVDDEGGVLSCLTSEETERLKGLHLISDLLAVFNRCRA